MKTTLLLTTTVLAVSTARGADINPLIVGGSPVADGVATYVTAVRGNANAKTYCGGSLIHPKWVLSAAHCASGPDYVNGTTDGVSLPVKRAIVHPLFKTAKQGNDFMLLELEKNVTAFEPVALARADGSDDVVGAIATVRGWGTTVSGGAQPKRLQELSIKVVDSAVCRPQLASLANITATMLCAGGEVNKDSCQGDSGGPLVVKNADGKDVQIGIVSWGSVCGDGKPGVYSRVSSARAFIEQYVGPVKWL